jgi:hypothetical protein
MESHLFENFDPRTVTTVTIRTVLVRLEAARIINCSSPAYVNSRRMIESSTDFCIAL